MQTQQQLLIPLDIILHIHLKIIIITQEDITKTLSIQPTHLTDPTIEATALKVPHLVNIPLNKGKLGTIDTLTIQNNNSS